MHNFDMEVGNRGKQAEQETDILLRRRSSFSGSGEAPGQAVLASPTIPVVATAVFQWHGLGHYPGAQI